LPITAKSEAPFLKIAYRFRLAPGLRIISMRSWDSESIIS